MNRGTSRHLEARSRQRPTQPTGRRPLRLLPVDAGIPSNSVAGQAAATAVDSETMQRSGRRSTPPSESRYIRRGATPIAYRPGPTQSLRSRQPSLNHPPCSSRRLHCGRQTSTYCPNCSTRQPRRSAIPRTSARPVRFPRSKAQRRQHRTTHPTSQRSLSNPLRKEDGRSLWPMTSSRRMARVHATKNVLRHL